MTARTIKFPKPVRCQCRICKLLRAIEPLRKRTTWAEGKALDSILADWEHCSTSAAYWELKAKGTWPEHDPLANR